MKNNIIPIDQLEIFPHTYLNIKSPMVLKGIQNLRNKRKIYEEDYEDVIDFFELLEEMYSMVGQNKE